MTSQLKTEEVRAVAGTALTGSLADVGAVTESPARTIVIFNGADEQVVVSWDNGRTNGFSMPATSAVAIDAPANPNENNARPFLAAGSQFKVSHDGAVPTSGKVTITVIT